MTTGTISELLRQYGNTPEDIEKLLPQLIPALEAKRTTALEIPRFLTQQDLESLGVTDFSLDTGWVMKLIPKTETITFISPSGEEVNQGDVFVNPDTGAWATKKEIEQIYQEQGGTPGVSISASGIAVDYTEEELAGFQTITPMAARNLLNLAQTDPEFFIKNVHEIGRTSDLEAILGLLDFTPEQINAVFNTKTLEDLIKSVFQLGYEGSVVPTTQAVMALLENDPEAFIGEVVKRGWNFDTEYLLRSLYPEITDEDLGEIFGVSVSEAEYRNLTLEQQLTKQRWEAVETPQWTKAITAGVGDVISSAAGVFGWLGAEDLYEGYSQWGETLQLGAPPYELGDFNWGDLLHAEFWTEKLTRALPFTLSLVPLMAGGWVVGSAIATAAGIGRIGTYLFASFGSGALSRAGEAAMEAGGAYNDAITQGLSDEEASRQAREVFTKNMTLSGWDAAQIAIMLAPTPKFIPMRLINSGLVRTATIGGKMVIVGLSEGGEEILQEIFQKQARGEEIHWDATLKEVFAIGAIFGIGMGLGGDVVSQVMYRTKENLSTEDRARLEEITEEKKDQGVSSEQAEAQALEQLTDESREALENFKTAVKGIKQEQLDAETFEEARLRAEQVKGEALKGAEEIPEVTGPTVENEITSWEKYKAEKQAEITNLTGEARTAAEEELRTIDVTLNSLRQRAARQGAIRQKVIGEVVPAQPAAAYEGRGAEEIGGLQEAREPAEKLQPELVAPQGAEEISPGITAAPPGEITPPPRGTPQTIESPTPPPNPNARERIIAQSQEVVNQSKPGLINRLWQKMPIIGQLMRWERPALRAFAENNPHLVVAQVAESAARADVAARQVITRLPLFKQLYNAFGERALRGEKTDIEFLGSAEQAANHLTGTLLDIAQNPELYRLTQRQSSALEAINTHNDASLDYVVRSYGAEIGRYAPKPGGAFLSNVDISEDMMVWFESEERAIAQGRGKTRYWATARERINSDKSFKPELDVKKLIEGMDAFKARQAAGITFREVAGGMTRLEVLQETHPQLYERMMGLRARLQKLRGYKNVLVEQQLNAIDVFMVSPYEEADITALEEAFFLQPGRYVARAMGGTELADIESQIEAVKNEIRELKPAWVAANPKPYVFVQQGLYRYFKPTEAKYIVDSRKVSKNPILNFIERWRGQAFSGDFSPFAIQGSLGILADPLGSLGDMVKGVFNKRGPFKAVSLDALVEDMTTDPEGWAEFASLLGRNLLGVPEEYAAGFLSAIPGFNKLTANTYISVTRGCKNLYDRIWGGLVRDGASEVAAKVAAIEAATKVFPLINPTKLGQSPARAAFIRAMPTSYSFIRQPVTMMTQASTGFAKLFTFQKLSPQERIAVRIMTTMAASTLAVSAISAALSALAKGGDEDDAWQAVLDAINPNPSNGRFASVIIGDFRIPLGGPYRAFFRALYPQEVEGVSFPVPFAGIPNFIFNRISPALKTQINLLRNKDYYGQAIIKGEFPENIIRGILYELEGALPLSAGELLQGWRREATWEDILQQVAAQFVGVNLIKLDNTYFHKILRNLGLPEEENQLLYSTERPIYDVADEYGAVVKVLSDETLEEVKKQKGYPPEVAIIIEARDIKRQLDLLSNYSPGSLNADPALGDTYTEYYDQWLQRQRLVEAGDDAEWSVLELEGGEYRKKTYHGEDALKAFDKQYPQAESGNMSQAQYSLLTQYWSLPEYQRADFLKTHPELSENPREEWLKSHPQENAQLAIWGQTKVYTREAYNIAQKLITELDIPSVAVSEYLPDKEYAEDYFKYLELVDEWGTSSAEVRLFGAEHPELFEWLDREPVTDNPNVLKLTVQYREQFDVYDSLDTGERDAYLVSNPEFNLARYKIDAYNINFPENLIDTYADWYMNGPTKEDDPWYETHPSETFYGDDWWLLGHKEFYDTMVSMGGWQPRDFSKVPTQEVFAQYKFYLALEGREIRLDYRRTHPELDNWLVLVRGLVPIGDR